MFFLINRQLPDRVNVKQIHSRALICWTHLFLLHLNTLNSLRFINILMEELAYFFNNFNKVFRTESEYTYYTDMLFEKPMWVWKIAQCKSILVDLNNGIMISKNGHDMGPLHFNISSPTTHTKVGQTALPGVQDKHYTKCDHMTPFVTWLSLSTLCCVVGS